MAWRLMDVIGVIRGHHVKWNKQGSERQKPHVFSDTW
jgi:hypothetical protein